MKNKLDFFKESIFFYQKLLGFTDVQINIFETKKQQYRAAWESDIIGRQISIFVNTDWLKDKNVSFNEIDLTCFHEVYESQFFKIDNRMKVLFNENHTASLIHDIVRRAEYHIYPLIKRKW